MTNPTRAEIQAQNVDEIDKQIEALTEKRRELTRCWVSATRIADSESGHRKVEIQMRTRTISLILHDDADVIPAADLIPREEHERALELEALKTKAFMNIALQLHAAAQRVFGEDVIAEFQEDDYAPERIISMFEQAAQNPPMRDGRTPEGVWHDAVSCIISRFVDGDAAGEMSHIYKGREYRVTVERVEDTHQPGEIHTSDTHQPAEGTPDELVGWANRYEDGYGGVYDTPEEAKKDEDGWTGPALETAVPLYRRPQPDNAADAVAYLVKEYDTDTGHQDTAEPRTYRHTLRRHYKVTVHRAGEAVAVAPKGVVDALLAVTYCRTAEERTKADSLFARITELPEPSEWAKEVVASRIKGGQPAKMLDLASAYILLAKEVDRE